MEKRSGARSAGLERSLPAARPQPRGHPRAFRAGQASAGLLMTETIHVGDIAIAVTRKDVKHVHLSVHPPDGRVTLVAPKNTRPEVARAYAVSRLSWIRNQRRRLLAQARETPRQFVGRESHFLWGRRYLLTVREADAKPSVRLSHRSMTLTVRPGSSRGRRETVIHQWHKSL